MTEIFHFLNFDGPLQLIIDTNLIPPNRMTLASLIIVFLMNPHYLLIYFILMCVHKFNLH